MPGPCFPSHLPCSNDVALAEACPARPLLQALPPLAPPSLQQ